MILAIVITALVSATAGALLGAVIVGITASRRHGELLDQIDVLLGEILDGHPECEEPTE